MNEQETTDQTPVADAEGWEWAIVEIMGHRKHYGRVREEERFGAKMLRVDIPKEGRPESESGWSTLYYSGSAIFSYALTDEETVIRANRPYMPPGRLSIASSVGELDDDEIPI